MGEPASYVVDRDNIDTPLRCSTGDSSFIQGGRGPHVQKRFTHPSGVPVPECPSVQSSCKHKAAPVQSVREERMALLSSESKSLIYSHQTRPLETPSGAAMGTQ